MSHPPFPTTAHVLLLIAWAWSRLRCHYRPRHRHHLARRLMAESADTVHNAVCFSRVSPRLNYGRISPSRSNDVLSANNIVIVAAPTSPPANGMTSTTMPSRPTRTVASSPCSNLPPTRARGGRATGLPPPAPRRVKLNRLAGGAVERMPLVADSITSSERPQRHPTQRNVPSVSFVPTACLTCIRHARPNPRTRAHVFLPPLPP